MRWIARGKSALAYATWLAAVGAALAVEPDTGRQARGPVRASQDAPEWAGAPILVPPPNLHSAPPPIAAEFNAPVARPAPGSVAILAPEPDATSDSRGNGAEPSAATPTEASPQSAVTQPQQQSAKPTISPVCECCETNPWASVPSVQITPRLGFFLVPPTGSGFYSAADWLHGLNRDRPPAFPYPPLALAPPSRFDDDYRYLDHPENAQFDPFDVVKRVHPTPDTMLTVGGQHSIRYMNEVDSRLGRADNTYALIRNRVFADVWYQDRIRVYGEFISALIEGNELAPLPIDENRADILNLFVEVKVADVAGHPAYVRIGRQELLFGSQRLVSTLDWANVRRTFDGVRAYWRSEQFDVDAFWTRPVVIEPGDFDSANQNVQFYGAWATFRPAKGQFIDLYYLGLSDDTIVRSPFAAGRQAPRGTQGIHTFGARYAGNQGPLLYDFEGMVQSGTWIQRDHRAYAWTTEVGWVFEDMPWRPQVWAGYDYASGTPDPVHGDHRTFNQLFAFGHYYFGFLDLVGRQNIEDLNFQLAAYPDNWITLVAQYHHFRLAENRDFLYSAAGRPTRRSATGVAGPDVGDEIDFLANLHLTAHQDVLLGYSKLFAGDFIKRTGPNVSPELFYVMYNFRW